MSNTYFSTKGEHYLLSLENKYGSIELTPYGATVLSWKTNGGDENLWLSPYSYMEKGKPIRGGIPVCFPWFGQKRDQAAWPLHGYARTATWALNSIEEKDNGTVITLSLDSKNVSDTYGYGPCRLEYVITLSDVLMLSLTVKNTGNGNLTFESGLHTYFSADPQTTVCKNIDGLHYYDKIDDYKKKVRKGDFRFSSEVESADFYMNANKESFAINEEKTITVSHEGFSNIVIWNPGQKAGLSNSEIRESWNQFICLESASCMDNEITLMPTQSVTSKAILSVTRK